MNLFKLNIVFFTALMVSISSNSAIAANSGLDKLLLVAIQKVENAKDEALEESRSQGEAIDDARSARANKLQLQKNAKVLEQLAIDLKRIQLEIDKNCK